MTADHVTLLAALDHITSLEGKLGTAADKKAATTELRTQIDSLIDMMLPHLNEEEDELVPLIAKHLTEKGMDALIDEILAKLDPILLLWEAAPLILWHDFWCTEATGCGAGEKVIRLDSELQVVLIHLSQAHFLAKLPPPVLFLINWITIPRTIDVLATLKGIESGQHVPYSKWPRVYELTLLAVVFAVLFAVFKVLARAVRAVFCRKQTPKVKRN